MRETTERMVPGMGRRSRPAQAPEEEAEREPLAEPLADADPVTWKPGERARIGEDEVTVASVSPRLNEARVRVAAGHEIRVDAGLLEKVE